MPTLTILPLALDDATSVAAAEQLAVHPAQLPYVGTVRDSLATVSDEPSGALIPHVIMQAGVPVGYFVIDTHYGQRCDFAPAESLGLRAFLIDARRQGEGLGKRAVLALRPYLQSVFADRDVCYLTVNCQNPGARHCYLAGGFIDDGELYHGGEAGPQHVMWQAL